MVQHFVQFVKMVSQRRDKGVVRQRLEAEQHDFLRPGESGQVCLLQILFGNLQAEGIKPAAAVAAGPHAFEIRHQRIAQIPGKMLVGGHGIPGFRAGVNPVEEFALGGGIVSCFLIAFRPVWILDGNAAVRIGGLGRRDDIVPADLFHQGKAVFLPASVRNAPGCVEFIAPPAAGFAGTVGEEEIVDDKFAEVLSEESADILQAVYHLFVVVTEGVHQPLLRLIPFRGGDGGGQAAGNFHAVRLKNAPAQFHMVLIRHDPAPERLKIDLVHPHMLFKKRDILFQLFLFCPGGCLRNKIVYEPEIAIVSHTGFSFFIFVLRLQ